jgi:hypothetical protein
MDDGANSHDDMDDDDNKACDDAKTDDDEPDDNLGDNDNDDDNIDSKDDIRLDVHCGDEKGLTGDVSLCNDCIPEDQTERNRSNNEITTSDNSGEYGTRLKGKTGGRTQQQQDKANGCIIDYRGTTLDSQDKEETSFEDMLTTCRQKLMDTETDQPDDIKMAILR